MDLNDATTAELEKLVSETQALVVERFPDLDVVIEWDRKPTPPRGAGVTQTAALNPAERATPRRSVLGLLALGLEVDHHVLDRHREALSRAGDHASLEPV